MSKGRVEVADSPLVNEGINRTDEHSLILTNKSKEARRDKCFDEDGLIEKNKETLDSVKPLLSKLFIIEDTTNRGSSIIVTVQNRTFQYKGLVYAVGPNCKQIKKGDWVVWGLYNGIPFDGLVKGLKTWFIEEDNVLVTVEEEARLSI